MLASSGKLVTLGGVGRETPTHLPFSQAHTKDAGNEPVFQV